MYSSHYSISRVSFCYTKPKKGPLGGYDIDQYQISGIGTCFIPRDKL
jgi:hypothetical protein